LFFFCFYENAFFTISWSKINQCKTNTYKSQGQFHRKRKNATSFLFLELAI
jgi:hypothetical protein